MIQKCLRFCSDIRVSVQFLALQVGMGHFIGLAGSDPFFELFVFSERVGMLSNPFICSGSHGN